MTTIRATCPTCGDVDLESRDFHIVTAPAAGWAIYSFECPNCADEVTKSADDEVVTLLRGAGVSVERIAVPAEALEAHFGPPIDADDLIDFGLNLHGSDRLVARLTGERQRTADG